MSRTKKAGFTEPTTPASPKVATFTRDFLSGVDDAIGTLSHRPSHSPEEALRNYQVLCSEPSQFGHMDWLRVAADLERQARQLGSATLDYQLCLHASHDARRRAEDTL